MSRHQKLVNTRNQPLGVDADETPREERGRTTAPQTPVSIHADGVELPEALYAYVHKKLGAKLGAFALQIDRVAVRFADINGPRGGTDSECRVQVLMAGRPQIVVTERAEDLRSAFDAASQAAGRAVKRDLERAGFTQGLRAARRHKRPPTRCRRRKPWSSKRRAPRRSASRRTTCPRRRSSGSGLALRRTHPRATRRPPRRGGAEPSSQRGRGSFASSRSSAAFVSALKAHNTTRVGLSFAAVQRAIAFTATCAAASIG